MPIMHVSAPKPFGILAEDLRGIFTSVTVSVKFNGCYWSLFSCSDAALRSCAMPDLWGMTVEEYALNGTHLDVGIKADKRYSIKKGAKNAN